MQSSFLNSLQRVEIGEQASGQKEKKEKKTEIALLKEPPLHET